MWREKKEPFQKENQRSKNTHSKIRTYQCAKYTIKSTLFGIIGLDFNY